MVVILSGRKTGKEEGEGKRGSVGAAACPVTGHDGNLEATPSGGNLPGGGLPRRPVVRSRDFPPNNGIRLPPPEIPRDVKAGLFLPELFRRARVEA